MEPTIMPLKKATSAQLKRAAGSQSLDKLRKALVGWTIDEINHAASKDGKNAVHFAAWTGCLENLDYLVTNMGADVNVIATGEYSYGKTPIFFAATRSRNDVVKYLLGHGAFVKIVNNKGQSVLSIASSHLEEDIITEIQNKEKAQSDQPWRNYRTTHSDHLEYGDLDRRFLDRQLRETDVVSSFAINPTTKQSRKGGFYRRNPQCIKNTTSKKKDQCSSSVKQEAKLGMQELSTEDENNLMLAWENLLKDLEMGGGKSEDIITIMSLNEKQRKPWISQAAIKLRDSGAKISDIENFIRSIDLQEEREDKLLQKLLAKVLKSTAPDTTARPISGPRTSSKQALSSRSLFKKVPVSSNRWVAAYDAVGDCSMALFENGKSVLSLSQSPCWVDTLQQLNDIEQTMLSSSVVAIDTEWLHCPVSNEVRVSTIQLAIPSNNVWVVDMIQPDIIYQTKCREFVKQMFQEKCILGFSIGHDIPKLEKWLGEPLSLNTCLDVQSLWDGPQLPGLAACVNEFSSVPLSKKEQCSDWSRRPLNKDQLMYAGLDAAVLLALLSQKKKSG